MCFVNTVIIYELSCVCGKNAKAAVKRIMAKLFTNNFLKEYSFSGRKGKKKFSDLFICPLIISKCENVLFYT